MEPGRNILEPERNILEPERNILEPERNILEPGRNILEPERSILEPGWHRRQTCITTLTTKIQVTARKHICMEHSLTGLPVRKPFGPAELHRVVFLRLATATCHPPHALPRDTWQRGKEVCETGGAEGAGPHKTQATSAGPALEKRAMNPQWRKELSWD
eukprot:gene2946-biopygen17115